MCSLAIHRLLTNVLRRVQNAEMIVDAFLMPNFKVISKFFNNIFYMLSDVLHLEEEEKTQWYAR